MSDVERSDFELEHQLRALFDQPDQGADAQAFALRIRRRIQAEQRLRLGMMVAALVVAGMGLWALLAGWASQAQAWMGANGAADGQTWLWPVVIGVGVTVWLLSAPSLNEA